MVVTDLLLEAGGIMNVHDFLKKMRHKFTIIKAAF
jgi:hypothetical protein